MMHENRERSTSVCWYRIARIRSANSVSERKVGVTPPKRNCDTGCDGPITAERKAVSSSSAFK
jgi:hypothetical protein